jgi:hypothetical protein
MLFRNSLLAHVECRTQLSVPVGPELFRAWRLWPKWHISEREDLLQPVTVSIDPSGRVGYVEIGGPEQLMAMVERSE